MLGPPRNIQQQIWPRIGSFPLHVMVFFFFSFEKKTKSTEEKKRRTNMRKRRRYKARESEIKNRETPNDDRRERDDNPDAYMNSIFSRRLDN